MTDIHFGTDGWRGRIAEDYTFDNVRRAAQVSPTILWVRIAAEPPWLSATTNVLQPSTLERLPPR